MTYHPNEVARRGRMASIVVLAIVGILGARFFSMQILQHAQYALQSDKNRLKEIPLPAARGMIYDRNGQVIVENVPGYTVSLLPARPESLGIVLRRLANRVNLSPAQVAAALRRHRAARNRPTVVVNDASFELVSQLEEHRVEFPGLIIQSTPKRFYPDSNIISAFSGYTAPVNDADLAADTAGVYKPDQQIGRLGLEQQYEPLLRGTEGSRFVEVDAQGRVVRDVGVRAELAPVAPPPLRTHIDMDVQRAIANLFSDSLAGGAVVLDPKTGDVIALFSNPGYNPNRFIGGIPAAYYDSLMKDPRKPMYNKAIMGAYEPGSTWKLATAVMALQDSLVRIDDHMEQPCDGGYTIGTGAGARRFKCHLHTGHGNLTLRGAIEQSCDVYFYQLGLKIGFRGLVAGGRRLGFGEETGIDLPFELASDFPPADSIAPKPKEKRRSQRDSLQSVLDAYYDRKFKGAWSKQSESLNLSIGQGANSETVISMARFYTALATDGQVVRPHIVGDSVVRTRIFTLTDDQMAGVREALVGVTAHGTAAASRIEGVPFAGKTGSAQNAADPKKDHGWFVGFAPANDPKVVVAVFLEFGLHGPRAARIAKSIVEAYLKTTVSNPNPVSG